MKIDEIESQRVYTDTQGRYRKVLAITKRFDGQKQVTYDKGFYTLKNTWHSFSTGECNLVTFARWAKETDWT